MHPIVFDFDGVLFDSAYEAYKVCQLIVSSKKINSIRTNITYEEFQKHRPSVADVKDFIPLYFINPNDIKDKNTFVREFYLQRSMLSKDPDYVKNYFPPFSFFIKNLDNIRKFSKNIYILSNRDEESINNVLMYHELNISQQVFGQRHIQKYGNKVNIFKKMIPNKASLYLDDLYEYKVMMNEVADISLMVNWGYGEKNLESKSEEEITEIFLEIIEKYN